jgi:hypothetical protein
MSWRSDMDEFGPDLDMWEEIDVFLLDEEDDD